MKLRVSIKVGLIGANVHTVMLKYKGGFDAWCNKNEMRLTEKKTDGLTLELGRSR